MQEKSPSLSSGEIVTYLLW